MGFYGPVTFKRKSSKSAVFLFIRHFHFIRSPFTYFLKKFAALCIGNFILVRVGCLLIFMAHIFRPGLALSSHRLIRVPFCGKGMVSRVRCAIDIAPLLAMENASVTAWIVDIGSIGPRFKSLIFFLGSNDARLENKASCPSRLRNFNF